MVMPRSRSIGLLSSTCASISRSVSPPHIWMMRSARVDLPWSTWAMMEKLRMFRIGSLMGAGVAVSRDGWGKRDIIAQRGARSLPGRAPDCIGNASRAGGLAGSVFRIGRGDRDEFRGAASVAQQHHGVAGFHPIEQPVQVFRAADDGAANARDHVAVTDSGAAGRGAVDARDEHALAVRQPGL